MRSRLNLWQSSMHGGRLNDGGFCRRKRQKPINQSLQVTDVAYQHSRDKTVFTRHMVGFDDLRSIDEHLFEPRYLAWHSPQANISGNPESERVWIDGNRVAGDRTRIFQLMDPLRYTGTRKTDPAGEIANRHARVLSQRRNYCPVDIVDGPIDVTTSVHRMNL